MTDQKWKTFDTRKTLDKQRQEATTSAGVGGFVGPAFRVPVMRPPDLLKRKKKDRK